MLVLLATLSAVLYGSGDFLGALAAKRSPAVAVVFWSQLFGASALLLVVPLLGGTDPTWRDALWGLAAGSAGGFGMVLLYAGLARGTMSVVSPITAVCAAVVPLLGGLGLGEGLDVVSTTGVVVGLGAVALLSVVPAEVPVGTPVAVVGEAAAPAPAGPHDQGRLAALMGVGAGVCFGLFFLALDRTGDDAGVWPLIAARVSSLTLLLVVGFAGRRLAAARDTWWLLPWVGLLDMAANVAFLLAAREGAVGLVAVLVALAPAATVVLAALVLRERVRSVQVVGLVGAASAVVLIALR